MKNQRIAMVATLSLLVLAASFWIRGQSAAARMTIMDERELARLWGGECPNPCKKEYSCRGTSFEIVDIYYDPYEEYWYCAYCNNDGSFLKCCQNLGESGNSCNSETTEANQCNSGGAKLKMSDDYTWYGQSCEGCIANGTYFTTNTNCNNYSHYHYAPSGESNTCDCNPGGY